MAEGVTRLIQGGVTSAQGFVAAGVHCGIKAQKKDLALVVSRVPAAAAGVFTTNKVKAAPVLLDMERVRSGQGQAVLLNSGNANACTGEQGMRDAREMARLAGEHLQMVEDLVYICSTGPIGVPLPMDAVRRGIPEAVRHLGADGTAAAEAILTTDTVSKTGAVQVTVGSQLVTVGGMSKGAGMIHPQMATTLSVLTTDAAVAPAVLNSVLRRAADASFNRITVDGDRSTNDTILIFANGEAGAPEITGPGEALDAFQAALDVLTDGLARAVARDGVLSLPLAAGVSVEVGAGIDALVEHVGSEAYVFRGSGSARLSIRECASGHSQRNYSNFQPEHEFLEVGISYGLPRMARKSNGSTPVEGRASRPSGRRGRSPLHDPYSTGRSIIIACGFLTSTPFGTAVAGADPRLIGRAGS